MARQFAVDLGYVPTSFSTGLRGLIQRAEANREGGSNGIDSATAWQVKRLLKSPSLLAPIYYATRVYHREAVERAKVVNAEFFISLYQPEELAALIALVLLKKRAKRICHAEEWPFVYSALQNSIDIGAMLGKAIPAIGSFNGMMMGGLRPLAWATFAKRDLKGFKAYRRHLKQKELAYDLQLEQKTWSCIHPQIASIISQSYGFGSQFAEGIFISSSSATEGADNPLIMALRVADLWIGSLVARGAPPEENIGDQYIIKEDQLESFVGIVQEIQGREDTTDWWLSRTGTDISPEKTPALYSEGGSGSDAEVVPEDAEGEEE